MHGLERDIRNIKCMNDPGVVRTGEDRIIGRQVPSNCPFSLDRVSRAASGLAVQIHDATEPIEGGHALRVLLSARCGPPDMLTLRRAVSPADQHLLFHGVAGFRSKYSAHMRCQTANTMPLGDDCSESTRRRPVMRWPIDA